jgi:hypothetical protein
MYCIATSPYFILNSFQRSSHTFLSDFIDRFLDFFQRETGFQQIVNLLRLNPLIGRRNPQSFQIVLIDFSGRSGICEVSELPPTGTVVFIETEGFCIYMAIWPDLQDGTLMLIF